MTRVQNLKETNYEEDECPLPFHLMPSLQNRLTNGPLKPHKEIKLTLQVPVQVQVQVRPIEPDRIDPNRVSGLVLKSYRESKKMTVEHVSARTKVPKKYIMAIEADDYENMPAPIYFRGFVTAYLREIGLQNQPQIVESLSSAYRQGSGQK